MVEVMGIEPTTTGLHRRYGLWSNVSMATWQRILSLGLSTRISPNHVKHLGTIEQKGAAVPEKIVLTRDLEHDPFCRIMLPLTLGRCAPGAMAVRSAQWR
jgi:hypothetical protein